MSIDISIRLFFPMASAPAALTARASIVRGEEGREVLVTFPGGGTCALPTGWPPVDPERPPVVFDEHVSIPLGDVAVIAVVRKKKRLGRNAAPKVNRWGDVENFEVVKERIYYPADIDINIGQDYFEINFTNIASRDASSFFSKPMRLRLAHLYSEGNGVAGIYDSMGEWSSFAEPQHPVTLPDDFDEEEAGLDALVEALIAIL